MKTFFYKKSKQKILYRLRLVYVCNTNDASGLNNKGKKKPAIIRKCTFSYEKVHFLYVYA